MASDIWLMTILIVRKETRCCHKGYSFRLAARVILYAPSHRQDSTYHCLCYTSRGALAGTGNSSMGPPHEGSIQWPIAPWANAFTTELHLAPPIKTGHWTNTPIEYWTRTFCTNDIGDKFHYVLMCTFFANSRKSLLKSYYYNRPNMFKFK